MTIHVELSDEDLVLMLQALEDAIAYRDARSHVIQSAVRRRDRRMGGPMRSEPDAGADHRSLARGYETMAAKLKRARPEA